MQMMHCIYRQIHQTLKYLAHIQRCVKGNVIPQVGQMCTSRESIAHTADDAVQAGSSCLLSGCGRKHYVPTWQLAQVTIVLWDEPRTKQKQSGISEPSPGVYIETMTFILMK